MLFLITDKNECLNFKIIFTFYTNKNYKIYIESFKIKIIIKFMKDLNNFYNFRNKIFKN